MRKLLITIAAMALVVLSIGTTSYAQAPEVTIRELDSPPRRLAVGETRIIRYRVESNQTFTSAQMLSDEFFPGRGVFFDGTDIEVNNTVAILELPITGKDSTANLQPPSDDPDFPGCTIGEAPAASVVGVRFGSLVISERFPFCVKVVE